jgi:endonuclease III-like uncharacterized protein
MTKILEALVYLDEPKVQALQRTFSKIVLDDFPLLVQEDLAVIAEISQQFLQDMEEVEDFIKDNVEFDGYVTPITLE